MKPYVYSIIRYRHDEVAGELVNIGVILWSPADRSLTHIVEESTRRLAVLYPQFDGDGYRSLLRALRERFHRASVELSGRATPDFFTEGLPTSADALIAKLMPSDGACFLPSQPMGGVLEDVSGRLTELFADFVTSSQRARPRRRDEDDVWGVVAARLRMRGLLGKLEENVEVQGVTYSHTFRAGWQNGQQQFLEPVSFDFASGRTIVEEALKWSGRLVNLRTGFKMTAVVGAPGRGDLGDAFRKAKSILAAQPKVRAVIEEAGLDSFANQIETDLAH